MTWSRPISDLHMLILLVDTNLVVIFLNYAIRTSLGTFSILHINRPTFKVKVIRSKLLVTMDTRDVHMIFQNPTSSGRETIAKVKVFEK